MKRLQGKVAIVTGASRNHGIGSSICRAFAKEGANVFFTHWLSYDAAQDYGEEADFPNRFQAELEEFGVHCAHMSVNLADRDASDRILDHVEQTLGKPQILVNNATHCEPISYAELNSEILDMHYAVNVRGTSLLSSLFVKRFGCEGGRIINLVSGQDKTPEPNNIAYDTTKGAVSIFTKCLAREVGHLGVTVNAVDPGPTDSGWMTHEIKEFLLPKFPMGRIGLPQDAAQLIAFLASAEAQWITGQIIHSDGGFWD